MAEYRGAPGGSGVYTEGGERPPHPPQVQGHEGGRAGEREGSPAGGRAEETGPGATEGSGFGGRGTETSGGKESTTRPKSQHEVTEADGFNGGLIL